MFDTREPVSAERLGDDELRAEAVELSAHIAAAQGRLVEVVAEIDRRRSWGPDIKTCAEWLSFSTGLSPHAAREHVALASALKELPATRAALQRGEVSFHQARAIARTGTTRNEHDVLELAKNSTCGQLQRVVKEFRRAADVALERTNEVHRARYLRYFFEDDSFVIRGRMTTDAGAVVATALEAAGGELRAERGAGLTEPSGGDPSPDEGEPPLDRLDARSADALVLVAESALQASNEAARGPATEVVLHVDATVLAQDAQDGRCEIENGASVAPETARRLACDAAILPLLEKDGAVIKAGRRTRRIGHALRRALVARDRMCRFPGCSRQHMLDGHHIRHWIRDGKTEPKNLLLLCRFHHTLVHESAYDIRVDGAGAFVFTRPDGSIVRELPHRSAGETLTDRNGRAGIAVVERTELPEGAGAQLDLDYITYALFFQDPVWEELKEELEDPEDPDAPP